MRIKRGVTKHAKHKKIINLAKGYRMSYSKLYRRAKEAVWHAGSYSLVHRRHKRAQKRKEWIKVISASLHTTDYSYSTFINALKKANIDLDRKVLSDMATDEPKHFEALVSSLRK